MGELMIDISHLSKLYRLGTIGTGSLRQDLQRWWTTAFLKKQDPFFQIEEDSSAAVGKRAFWALNDVNFQINRGEVWGLIGQNGAGKSTLLKIISRIIRPTKGVVRGRGKISSLLEVGTGFHEELTGRENIFISGYILGMKKAEVKKKFDEIIAFSGIEPFIDTPVKRYSSGMYVRLAFAVAAHLEPDILIVDEVLAVGDAEFQKKCLGKMREVSNEKGRTIIFVSHSMQAINNLCNKALWLQKGKVVAAGDVTPVVNKYVSGIQRNYLQQSWDDPLTAPGNEFVRIKSVQLIPHKENDNDPIDIRTPLTVKFQFWNLCDQIQLNTGLHLFSHSGECIFDVPSPAAFYNKGLVEGECNIPANFLNDGSYYFSIMIIKDTSTPLYYHEECISFDVEDYRGNIKWYGKWIGAVRPQFPFSLKQAEGLSIAESEKFKLK